ncbi:MAG: nidogen-like domain-containing protein [Verrucomicrobiia bacterium]
MKHSRDIFTPLFVLALGIGIACNPALRAQSGNSNGSWMKILLTNNTAVFTVYAPATNANGVFDLYFKTNLTDPPAWTWLQRGAQGQTNLVVCNLPPAQDYFALGVTNAIRPGFTNSSLPREDDKPSTNAMLLFAINFYGTIYSNVWVNNNGNVTFNGAQSAYIPASLIGLGLNIIAPYWADVDTFNPLSDVVTFGTTLVDGHAAFGVDWVNVGYFSGNADKLLSCQLVIIDRSDIAAGDFDMEFNYDKVQWQYGDASIGDPPHAGYASADGVSGYELPGSGVADAFLDSNVVTGLIYHNLNSSVPGRYFFSFRNGQPAP